MCGGWLCVRSASLARPSLPALLSPLPREGGSAAPPPSGRPGAFRQRRAAPARATAATQRALAHPTRGASRAPAQGCVVIAAALWAAADPGLRKRLLALLHQRGRSLDMIRRAAVAPRRAGAAAGLFDRRSWAGWLPAGSGLLALLPAPRAPRAASAARPSRGRSAYESSAGDANAR
jgi:hypothetical protein